MFDPNIIEKIRSRAKEWNDKVDKTLAKNAEREKDFRTTSGIPVKRAYSPEDIAELDYLRDLNLPGEYPHTRGVQPAMYRRRFWTMRQYAGYGTAEDTNGRYRLVDSGPIHKPAASLEIRCGICRQCTGRGLPGAFRPALPARTKNIWQMRFQRCGRRLRCDV